MLITIDTSAIIAVITHESSRDHMIDVSTGHQLIAPTSIHWELGNAFSGMLKKARITLPEIALCLQTYRAIPIRLIDVSVYDALTTSKKHRMYAYDAYLIECAKQYAAALLTLDKASGDFRKPSYHLAGLFARLRCCGSPNIVHYAQAPRLEDEQKSCAI